MASVLYALPASAAEAPDGAIRLNGTIETDDAELSFKQPGRLVERLVSEGDTVKAGQIVARLDPAELEQEHGMRLGEFEAAEAALADLTAGSRPEEIAQAEAARQRARAILD
ncbi:MAG TPA: biotin/lipoyl-binding protein, partial [Candidatus Ozemobacteraceae bacterium]